MKFWEVLPLAVEQGKKIGRRSWSESEFCGIRLSKDRTHFVWNDDSALGAGIDPCDMLADDWEVVEENPHEEGTGPWAAWWLERGGYITRDCWGGMKATRRADGSIRVIDERNLVTNYSLTAHDLAATDWQLVEED